MTGKEEFDLGAYLKKSVENFIRSALKATADDPRESAYIARFALSCRSADDRRAKAEKRGEHIPTMLIAGITPECNLNCTGCYSRKFHTNCADPGTDRMTRGDWDRVFSEAEDLGISFILLAGGEPLLCRDIIETAGNYPGIFFPVFTNGTLLDEKYIKLFDEKRNLFPVISIEGRRDTTDNRRGSGIYDKVNSAMKSLRESHLIFGVSITVTTANLQEVTERDFLDRLLESGCKAVIYVEYVPVTEDTSDLAPAESERALLQDRLVDIRKTYPEAVFISFPGDEKSSAGCLAAGRGFFHINSYGGAEPCPFSPYSDTNVRNNSLLETLRSPLFRKIREQNVLAEDHSGGCVLFEKRDQIEKLVRESG